MTDGYQCEDREIANVLTRKGWKNRFCSIECFVKAAKLIHVA